MTIVSSTSFSCCEIESCSASLSKTPGVDGAVISASDVGAVTSVASRGTKAVFLSIWQRDNEGLTNGCVDVASPSLPYPHTRLQYSLGTSVNGNWFRYLF